MASVTPTVTVSPPPPGNNSASLATLFMQQKTGTSTVPDVQADRAIPPAQPRQLVREPSFGAPNSLHLSDTRTYYPTPAGALLQQQQVPHQQQAPGAVPQPPQYPATPLQQQQWAQQQQQAQAFTQAVKESNIAYPQQGGVADNLQQQALNLSQQHAYLQTHILQQQQQYQQQYQQQQQQQQQHQQQPQQQQPQHPYPPLSHQSQQHQQDDKQVAFSHPVMIPHSQYVFSPAASQSTLSSSLAQSQTALNASHLAMHQRALGMSNYAPTPRYSYLPRGNQRLFVSSTGQTYAAGSPVDASISPSSTLSVGTPLAPTNNIYSMNGGGMDSPIVSPVLSCNNWRDACLVFKGQLTPYPHLLKAFDRVITLWQQETGQQLLMGSAETTRDKTTMASQPHTSSHQQQQQQQQQQQPQHQQTCSFTPPPSSQQNIQSESTTNA